MRRTLSTQPVLTRRETSDPFSQATPSLNDGAFRIGESVGDVADPYCSLTTKRADFDPTAELFTVPEAARFLRVSVSSMRRLQQGRRLPFVKIGGCIRFSRSDLAAYVQRCRVESIRT